MPNGFAPILNFLRASMAPMLPAKHEPASMILFLWVMLNEPTGNSTFVLKFIVVFVVLRIGLPSATRHIITNDCKNNQFINKITIFEINL